MAVEFIYAGTLSCPKCKQPMRMYSMVLQRDGDGSPYMEQLRTGICKVGGCGGEQTVPLEPQLAKSVRGVKSSGGKDAIV